MISRLIVWILAGLLSFTCMNPAWGGGFITDGFIYKPDLGARGANEKPNSDSGLDLVDARLAKEIWVGDPNYGATVQTAVTAIGSNTTALRIPAGTHNITADLTIPANITLKPERGTVFNIATGQTLTINGGLEAGLYQVFSCTGTGKVALGGSVKEVYPQWWYGGSGDYTNAFKAALNTLKYSTVKRLFVPQGYYTISSSLNFGTGINIVGAGCDNSALIYTATDGSACLDISDGTADIYNVAVKDLYLTGNNVATGPAISYRNLNGSLFENLRINYFNAGAAAGTSVGIKTYEGFNNTFRKISMFRTTIGIHLDGTFPNPWHLDGDLLHFEDIFHDAVDTTYGISYKISGLYMRMSWDGSNICDGVKYGVHCDGPAQQTGSCYNWTFRNVQCEVSTGGLNPGTAAFYLKIGATGGGWLERVTFDHCTIYNFDKAFDLQGVRWVKLTGGGFDGGAGKTVISSTADVYPLILDNFAYSTDATLSIAANKVMEIPYGGNNSAAPLAIYDHSDFATVDYHRAVRTITKALTYGTAVNVDARTGNVFRLIVTDTNAFTIKPPTYGADGQEITIYIRNSSGGTMGTITWDYKYLFGNSALPVQPKNNKYTVVRFVRCNSGDWLEVSRAENIWR